MAPWAHKQRNKTRNLHTQIYTHQYLLPRTGKAFSLAPTLLGNILTETLSHTDVYSPKWEMGRRLKTTFTGPGFHRGLDWDRSVPVTLADGASVASLEICGSMVSGQSRAGHGGGYICVAQVPGDGWV